MRKDSLKKFIMVFLAVVLFLQPLSTVLVFAKGFTNKNSSIKMISEKLDMEEVLSEEISDDSPKQTNLTIHPIGELPKDIDSEIVLISKSGERFSKIIRDNKPVKFEGLLHDIYDAELFYTNQNGEEIQSTRRFDLRDESKNAFEFDLPTNMLQWTHGEVEISPNFQEIELFSPKSEEVVEKLFLETEIQGDELILRGVKEEDMDSKTHKEDFIMHVYDSEKDEAFDIVGKELELSKEEKKKYGKRIYESDYKINLKELKSNELEVDFLRGENQSYIQKIYLNNLGYEDYKNSIEKSENEEASNEIDGLAINDEEIFKLDGLSPMIMMRSLSPRGAGDTWDVTPKTVTGTNIDITDVSVKEGTNNSLVWTVVVNQKVESIFSHYYHHFMPDKAGGNVVPKEIKNSGAIMQTIADWGDSYYSRSDRSLKKGLYTYTITTDIPTGNTGKLPFKVVLGNSDNNGANSNKGNVSSILTATKQIVNKNFNFIVKDNSSPASIVNGAVIKLTDDSGKEVQGTTGANGKVALQGEFTADKEYILTVVSVPDGYKIPSPNTVRVKYSPTTANPNESTDVTVNIEKIETPTIEAKFENAIITDADIGLEIYSGLEATGTPIKTITIPKGNKVPIEGLVNGQQYTIKVVSSTPNLYETGATTSFTFNDQEPHIVVNLTKKTSENKLVVNFHEEKVDGPLTNKLDGQALKLSVNGEEVSATITDGVATFTNPAQGTYTLVDPAPSVEGYKLVSNASFNLNNTNGYQDWYIVKKGTKVSLEVKPPAGKTFPADMTVKLVDASNNVVKGPVSIGNGNLIFEDVPWGNGYQFIYENVPENWTHSGAMAKPFDIPENAEETKVTDQFGYNDPASDKSQISIKVVDNDNKPVQGFEFQIKDSNNNLVATVVSGTDGIAKTEVAKLAPGTYTVENTKRPAGYLKVDLPSVKLTDKKYNIAADVIAGKDGTQNQSNVYINVKDINGKAVPSEWLEFYKVKGSNETLVTKDLQTDEFGNTYITPLNVEDGYTYKIKLKANSKYKLIDEDGQTQNIIIEKKTSKQLNIKVDIKDGNGKITAFAHTKEGEPAPNLKIIIKKEGANLSVDNFRTLMNGKNTSKFLEIGKYEITLEESDVYKLADGEAATKIVEITNTNKTPEVDFIVEKKLIDGGTAGSITVEGKLIGEENQSMKTSWIVTVDKFESKPTKSGTVNTIRIPTNEMINPTKPILMRKIGNGSFEKVEVSGSWVRSGSYYEFKDKRNTIDDMTTEQVVYQYSFTATGIDTAEQYTTTATANINYNDPTKIIPPVSATKTLDKSESEPMVDLKGTGEGITDNLSRTVNWIYEGQVDVKVPGDLYFLMKRPKNSGLNSPNNTVKPVITIYEKGTETERTDINYEVIFDPTLDAYKIKFDTNLLSPFDFKVNYEMNIDDEQVVDEYKLDTKYIYQGIGMEKPKEYVPLTLTAPRQLPLPGKTIEKTSSCADALHKVNLYGEMSGDGTEILWTARVANLDKDKKTRPFTMDIKVGEGLGDAELMSVNSVGKSFPFVTKGNTTTDYVYDLKGDHNATKNFRVHTDTTYHYVGNDGSNIVGSYNYITDYRKPSFIAPYRNWKTDVRGAEYFLAWGSFGAYDDKANEADQSLKLGDYMEVSFKTPITDFSRMREKGSDGQYLGYEINVDTKAFEQKDRSKTNTATPVCHMKDTNLTLREEPNQTSVQEVMIIKSDIGQIIARGKYINDGNDIEWEMEVIPLRDGNSAFQNRDFKVNYQLVDSSNQPIPLNTGLNTIRNRNPKKVEGSGLGGGFDLTETRNDYSGELTLKDVGLNERLIYTFTTPVLEDKEDYRLKVEGFYWEKPAFQSGRWEKLADEDGSNIAYVIVDGKVMTIRANKKWENVYTNASKPDITLRLMQLSIDGSQKELTSKTVNTPNSEDFIETEFTSYEVGGETKPIPRFDPNGYRYQYILREDSLPGYSSSIVKMDGSGTLWNVVNTKDDIIASTEDPVKYVNREDGTYPEPYQQDGPDIRNADTKKLNTKGENYKIEYEDSIIGKSGQQTDIPGMFDMKLTMEGKGKSIGQGLDVVLVLDNSQSMRKDWNGNIISGSYEDQTKLYNMNQKVNLLIDEIFKENETNNVHNSRVGVVNFGTTNRSGNPGGRAGYQHRPAGKNSLEQAYYNELDMIGLTDDKTQIDKALPKAVHWGGSIAASENTGDINLRNRQHGLTNIAGAVAEAGELLYPSGESSSGRKKVMIILSDGAPTASVKLKNYPLDTNMSLSENLASTGIGDGYAQYTVANNRYYLQKQTYTTNNGIRIENHGISAIAISDYYQKLHPDMEVYSLAMNKSGSGFEDPGTNSYGPTEKPEVIMEKVLRSLTTNHNENYFEAENTEELAKELDKIKNSLQSRSIINGEVIDPMGDQVSLRVEKNFKPASNAQLTDGDYFLSDNFGNFLVGYDSDGNAIVGNKLGDPDNNITANVQVFDRTESTSIQYPIPRNNREYQDIRIDQNGQPIRFMLDGKIFENVNSKDGTYKYVLAVHHDFKNPESPSTVKAYRNTREFTVLESLKDVISFLNGGYRLILIKNNDVKLKGINHVSEPLSTVGEGETLDDKVEVVRKDKNLLSGVKVTREGQTIKINGLNLGDDEEVTLQYRIHLKTEDPEFVSDFYYQANKTTTLNPQPDKGDYYRYFPIPSVKGPYIPLRLEKVWLDDDENPLTNPPDIDILAKINRYEVALTSEGTIIPDITGNASVIDSTKQEVREVILNKSNNWTSINNDLPAYDNKGKLFVYKVEEVTSVEGFKSVVVKNSPEFTYTKADGYEILKQNEEGELVPDPDGVFEHKINNTQTETPMGEFKIKKVDNKNPDKLLEGGIFTLTRLNSSGEAIGEPINRTTGKDGLANFGNLEEGTYILKEIKAPPGYVLKAPEYTVEVGPGKIEGTNKLKIKITYQENGEEKELKPINADPNSFVYQIDNESMELPNTGYTPGFPITLFALAIVILMAAFYIYKVNTKEVSDSN